jgi:hypothetical protein
LRDLLERLAAVELGEPEVEAAGVRRAAEEGVVEVHDLSRIAGRVCFEKLKLRAVAGIGNVIGADAEIDRLVRRRVERANVASLGIDDVEQLGFGADELDTRINVARLGVS